MRRLLVTYVVAALLVLGSCGRMQAADRSSSTPAVKKDVPYVPTPPEVVDEMLNMAKVTDKDVVYDLGCGDGRIVIAAAKEKGARGLGVDIDPQRIKESNENAQKAGVTDKVKFVEQSLFDTDLHEATVVTLYLLPSINKKLRPKLFKELKPGTRIVSHAFDMGDWEPDHYTTRDGRDIYYWVIPAQVDGAWQCTITTGQKQQQGTIQIQQKYQQVAGSFRSEDRIVQLVEPKLVGTELSFSLNGQKFVCAVDGEKMTGKADDASITAKRQ